MSSIHVFRTFHRTWDEFCSVLLNTKDQREPLHHLSCLEALDYIATIHVIRILSSGTILAIESLEMPGVETRPHAQHSQLRGFGQAAGGSDEGEDGDISGLCGCGDNPTLTVLAGLW